MEFIRGKKLLIFNNHSRKLIKLNIGFISGKYLTTSTFFAGNKYKQGFIFQCLQFLGIVFK
jgi:hypothetical protein